MNDFRFIFSPEDVARLDRVAAQFPKLVVRNWTGTANQIRNAMAKTLREGGGRYGVPTFAPRHHITLRLGKPAWGGMISKAISRWGNPYRGGQFWGFVDGIRAWFGEDLQTSESRSWTRGEKRYLRRRLRTRDIGGGYTRPARPFIQPFADNIPNIVRKEFVPRVLRALQKELRT